MKKTALVAAVATLTVASAAMAIVDSSTFTSTSFGYDLYDIAVKKFIGGPIGFIGGVMSIVLGAVAAIRAQVMLAIPAVIGGAALLNAEKIINSLGALV